MHGPPSVSLPVGRSRWHGVAVAVMACLASIASVSLFFSTNNHSISLLAANVSLALGLSGVAVVLWLRSPQGLLRWDGQQWWWSDRPVQGIRCTLDAQKAMLLNIELEGGHAIWLCLERPRGTTATWRAMRRALVFARRLKLRPIEVLSKALP